MATLLASPDLNQQKGITPITSNSPDLESALGRFHVDTDEQIDSLNYPQYTAPPQQSNQVQLPPNWDSNNPDLKAMSPFDQRVLFTKWQMQANKAMNALDVPDDQRKQYVSFVDNQSQNMGLQQTTASKILSFGKDVFGNIASEIANYNPVSLAEKTALGASPTDDIFDVAANKIGNFIKGPEGRLGGQYVSGLASSAMNLSSTMDTIKDQALLKMSAYQSLDHLFGLNEQEQQDTLKQTLQNSANSLKNLQSYQGTGAAYKAGEITGGLINYGAMTAVGAGLAPELGLTALTGGLASSSLYAGADGYANTYAAAVPQFMKQGMNFQEANHAAQLPAILAGTIDAGINWAFGSKGLQGAFGLGGGEAVAQGLSGWLKQIGFMGTMGGTTALANDINARYTYNPDMSIGDITKDVLANALGFGALGAILHIPSLANTGRISSEQSNLPESTLGSAAQDVGPATTAEVKNEQPITRQSRSVLDESQSPDNGTVSVPQGEQQLGQNDNAQIGSAQREGTQIPPARTPETYALNGEGGSAEQASAIPLESKNETLQSSTEEGNLGQGEIQPNENAESSSSGYSPSAENITEPAIGQESGVSAQTPEVLKPELPLVGMGNATQQEFLINRTIDGGDVFNGLKRAFGREPTREEWENNYKRINPDLERADYDQLYQLSKAASDSFDAANGKKPMPEVVNQLIQRNTPENAEIASRSAQPVTGTKNATVDQEMRSRGLAATEDAARKSFGQTWEEAARIEHDKPQYADELINELKEKPRPVNDVENATLLRRQISLQNQYDAVARRMIEAHESGNVDALAEAKSDLARLSDNLESLRDITKSVGTETGRGLAARRMMAKQDYSLSNMLLRKRAANEGRELTPAEVKEVSEQSQKIQEANDKLAEHQEKIDDLRLSKEQAESKIDELNQQLKENEKQEEELKKSPDKKEQSRLKAFKTRTAKRIAELQDRLNRGDFSPKPKKPPLKLDAEGEKLLAERNRLQEKFDEAVVKDALKQRTSWEKVQDTLVKWRRGFILSSPVVLGKLSTAALERIGFSALEEATGGLWSKILPGIAKKAPREGGLNIKAEAKAITDGFTKGMADSWKMLTTGKSDLERAFGRKDYIPHTAIDFLGTIHGALKAPAKRAEFSRSLEKRTAHSIAIGEDAYEPAVQMRNAILAYKDANRAIFMNDNMVVDAYKRALSRFNQVNKETGKIPAAAKIAGTTANVLLPIVKIPTNIVAETFQYALGHVFASGKIASALWHGMEKLGPNEADSIMRNLKKGSVGTAMLLLGFFNPENVGGYYQHGEDRDENDVKYGGLKLFGYNIPRWAVHNPLLEQLQVGATIRRVMQSDSEHNGLSDALKAAVLGVTEETPFIRQMIDLSSLYGYDRGERFTGNLAQSLVVPQAVSYIARKMDTDEQGNPIQRENHTLLEYIQAGIPGLREKLDEK